MKDCIISTPAVNSYGFRVLTEGIDISQFEKNPLLLWMHKRPIEDNSPLPIGRVENLRVEEGKLIGTPVFDQKDDFAKQIEQKWVDGILNMVSAGLDVMEVSEDEKLALEGQTLSTVTKCRLREVSIVDIGANSEALGFEVNLCKGNNTDIKEILKPVKNLFNAGVIENEIDLRFNEIEKRLAAVENDNFNLLKKVEEEEKKEIAKLIDDSIHKGIIKNNAKELYLRIGCAIGKEDFVLLVSTMPKPIRPSDIIVENNKSTKLKDLSFEELSNLYQNNKEEYNAIYKAEYGFEPQKEF